MFCDCLCPVSLPQSAVDWSTVCDSGISWSYSLTVWVYGLGSRCWVSKSDGFDNMTRTSPASGVILMLGLEWQIYSYLYFTSHVTTGTAFEGKR